LRRESLSKQLNHSLILLTVSTVSRLKLLKVSCQIISFDEIPTDPT
jgi:hypothetical protein